MMVPYIMTIRGLFMILLSKILIATQCFKKSKIQEFIKSINKLNISIFSFKCNFILPTFVLALRMVTMTIDKDGAWIDGTFFRYL